MHHYGNSYRVCLRPTLFTLLLLYEIQGYLHALGDFSRILSLSFVFRRIHGNLGTSTVEGSEIIEPEEWHHLVFRFDAQSKFKLFVKYHSS